MNTNNITVLIYALGFIGLASIGLIPIRAWRLSCDIYSANVRLRLKRLLFIVALMLAAGALYADLQIALRIFKCLTENYCGPSIASGWLYLAMLGVVYIGFELLAFAIKKLREVFVH
jgi:hypothetical protein